MVKQYGYATGKQRENGLGEIIPLVSSCSLLLRERVADMKLNRVREVQRTFRRTADAVASSTSPVSSTSKKPLDAVSQGPTATSSGATGPSEAKGAMTQLSTAASSLFTVSSSWSSTCMYLYPSSLFSTGNGTVSYPSHRSSATSPHATAPRQSSRVHRNASETRRPSRRAQ